jgi:colicin import membrane protein
MARAAQIEQTALDSVALNLAPLVAPHRKQGRLSLRIERMPQGTRLTRGTRNNDNTWSLGSDELEDLAIQVPASAQKDFKIGVRVISLINGSTLVAVDVPIKPGEAVAGAAIGANAPPALSTADAAELAVLRQELAAAKESLAARDMELAERLTAAAAEAATQFQQTLAKAETAWTQAENARLASVQEQWQEKFAEALAELESTQTKAHEAQVRDLQEKVDALQAALDQGTAALQQAKSADAAARERGDTATQDALAQVAELKARLAEREGELARATAAGEAAKRDAEAALAKAEQAWREGEAARLAAAEAAWRETSAKALSEAHANADAQRSQGRAGERDLLTRVAELQAAVAERDEALARAQSASEQARARAAQDADARLAKAQENWAATQAARLAAVEADWRAKMEAAAKAAQSEQKPAPAAPVDTAELAELRDKVTALQAKLTLRDAAAARAAKLAEEERHRWQKEAQDVIVKAARERKADENARLAAAQAEWSKQAVRETALITARAEAAEAALTQLRIRAAEEAPLQRELASLRSALAIREAELEHYRGPQSSEADQLIAPEAAPEPTPAKPRLRLLREGLIAAAAGIALVTLWPTLSTMVPQPPAPQPPAAAVAVEPPPEGLPLATLIKDAKLRKTPSMYGDIVGKLPRDTKVEMLETKGEWTHVRRVGKPAKGEPSEGWAKAALLEEVVEEPEPPTKPAKTKKTK